MTMGTRAMSGLGRDEVQELGHHLLAVEQALVHVHVDHLRAIFHLLAGDRQRLFELLFLDQAAKPGRSGDVGALADVHEQGVVVDDQRLETGEAQGGCRVGALSWSTGAHGLGDGGDVIGCGAAATAHQVQQAGLGEFLERGGHLLGRLAVFAELIGQASVRMGAHQGVGAASQACDVGTELIGPERTVQADGERVRVAHRVPERFWRLTRTRCGRWRR